MSQELIEELYKLVDLIKESSEYKDTKLKENAMENDSNFLMLANVFQAAQDDYNRLFNLNVDLKNANKNLSEAKEKLMNLECVKAYNDSYKKMNSILKEISKSLLEGVLYESCRG